MMTTKLPSDISPTPNETASIVLVCPEYLDEVDS